MLSNDLLPTTFRNLVINDLIEQNALPISQMLLNDKERAKNELTEAYFQHFNRVNSWIYDT